MFEAYNSRWRLGLMALGSAGFVVLGLWLIGAFGGDHPHGLKAMVAGWAGVPFFGFCGLAILLRLRQRGPVVRIDHRGILWTQWSADHVIPWVAIERMGLVQIRRQKMVGLALSKAEMARPKSLFARMAGANEALVGFPLCLTVTGTDRSFDELVAAIERFRPRPVS